MVSGLWRFKRRREVDNGVTYGECVRVVAGSHVAYTAGVLDGLVDDLEHADITIVGVGVDVGGHPF